jgi:hypothetical protein
MLDILQIDVNLIPEDPTLLEDKEAGDEQISAQLKQIEDLERTKTGLNLDNKEL